MHDQKTPDSLSAIAKNICNFANDYVIRENIEILEKQRVAANPQLELSFMQIQFDTCMPLIIKRVNKTYPELTGLVQSYVRLYREWLNELATKIQKPTHSTSEGNQDIITSALSHAKDQAMITNMLSHNKLSHNKRD